MGQQLKIQFDQDYSVSTQEIISKLSPKLALVYSLLNEGMRVNSYIAYANYSISNLGSKIKKLKSFGINISSSKMRGSGLTEYYLTKN